MAEDKEQLKIEAELDTSNLKQDARKGFSDVSNEEKKLQTESKNTSKAIDDIGKSGKSAGNQIGKAMQTAASQSEKVKTASINTSNAIDSIGKAGKAVGRAMQASAQQSESALKSISNEAKNTEKSLNDVAKATKEIKFRQGLGLASKAITELAPVGQAAGRAMGMSDQSMDMAGSAISGALGGAMAGSVLGPLGAAGGALIGAATSLTAAASELKKAAVEQRKDAQDRYEAAVKATDDRATQAKWNVRMKGYAEALTSNNPKIIEKNKAKLEKEIAGYQRDNTLLQNNIDSARRQTDEESSKIGKKYSGTKRQKKLTKLFNKRSESIEASSAMQAENDSKIQQLKALLDIANGALDNAAKEQQKAAEQQKATADMEAKTAAERQLTFNRRVSLNDASEARASERESIQTQVNNLIKDDGFSKASKLVQEQIDKYQKWMQVADKAMRDSSLDVSQRQNAMDTRNQFKSQLDFYMGLAEKVNAARTASDGADKKANSSSKIKAANDQISNLSGKLSDVEKIGNTKLSDSLTRVGGGSGYGVQMNGVANNVTKITGTLKSMLDELKKMNDRETQNSTEGVFIA